MAARQSTKAKREKAFQLYLLLGSYEKTADYIGAALSTVKKWAKEDEWQKKKAEKEKEDAEYIKNSRSVIEEKRLLIKRKVAEQFFQQIEDGKVEVDYKVYMAIMKDSVDTELLKTEEEKEENHIHFTFSIHRGPEDDEGEEVLFTTKTDRKDIKDTEETEATLKQVYDSYKGLYDGEEEIEE